MPNNPLSSPIADHACKSFTMVVDGHLNDKLMEAGKFENLSPKISYSGDEQTSPLGGSVKSDIARTPR